MFDEFGDIVVRRPQQDVFGRAALDDAAPFENGDPIAELHGLVEIVADEDDRLLQFLLQQQQFVLQLVADQRIERRERLVHQQNVGVGGECARQPDALLHAAGQFVTEFARPLRQTDHGEFFRDDPVHFALR